jgi:hypothetical protein
MFAQLYLIIFQDKHQLAFQNQLDQNALANNKIIKSIEFQFN